MHEALECFDSPPVPFIEEPGGRWAEGGKHAPDGGLDRCHAPESEGCRKKGHDFAIPRILEAMREREGIGVEPPAGPFLAEPPEMLGEARQIGTRRTSHEAILPVRLLGFLK